MSDLPAETWEAIQRAAALMRAARHIVALTGAGYSTPSGIPDFRSTGSGLWTKYLPMEVASLTTFRTKPELFFAWLQPLASHMYYAQPNSAHRALAELEVAGKIKAVITQNIDGLHHRAGSLTVHEVHGTFNSLTCVSCFRQFHAQGIMEIYLETGNVPHCPECGRILKPDIILFEEQLPMNTWRKAEKASQECDLMLVAGTSLEVMPSAILPVRALDHGAKLVMINKSTTYVDVRADVLVHGDVADIMPILVEEVLSERG
jgi:NAD-dependent deacetylase